MKFFKSRLLAIIVLSVVSAMCIGIFAAGRIFTMSLNIYGTPSCIVQGEYSVDDGPWKEINLREPITDRFHKIVCRGILISGGNLLRELDISFRNVWVSLKTADGELLYSNTYRIEGSEGWNAMMAECDTEEEKQETTDFYKRYMPLSMHTPQTPGFEHITFIPEFDFPEYKDEEFIFTVENPYSSSQAFSDCVTFTLSDGNGTYLRALWETLFPSAVFLLVCFFGLFLFPTISFIFGKINYRYLSFGFLCFFWAVFRILSLQSFFLNNVITDPVLCMMIHRLSIYFFFAALIVYFRANLHQEISRTVSGMAAVIFLLIVTAALFLHFMTVCDLIATSSWIHILMGIILLILVFLLAREARTDRSSLRHMLSWTPMALTLFADILNQFVPLGRNNFFVYGFSLTLGLQIVQLVFDLQRQYKAALHYEQVQKELYEARVSVMASQIRPHFMYNALTSIAMMCTIDPPVAQEATVTFAKYLRENMDSLRQSTPVPFTQELDHLKKYLYIEKLRFQNKLNIVYDITVTDFVLPLLSVQPLVENAVKHGVGMKKKGGTVKIATRETENAYAVIISDDGAGFDPSAQNPDDGRSHVGMKTTRSRLKEMCGGSIMIESTVGEGTVATIVLPKEGQKNENIVSG